jgi:hypothetical protein
MKSVARLVIVMVLFALVLPIASISAQEGEDDVVYAEPAGTYWLTAASGSFADQGDGAYLLTLESVAAQVRWISTAPALSMAMLDNANLNAQWAASEGLVTDALLSAEGLDIHMVIGSPVYDGAASVQTYAVTDVTVTDPTGEDKEPELPMTFGEAELLISWNLAFQSGLLQGTLVMYEGVRVTPEECAEAQAKLDEYTAWFSPTFRDWQLARSTCKGWDGTTDTAVKAAACAVANDLKAQMDARYAEVSPYITILNSGCPAPTS